MERERVMRGVAEAAVIASIILLAPCQNGTHRERAVNAPGVALQQERGTSAKARGSELSDTVRVLTRK